MTTDCIRAPAPVTFGLSAATREHIAVAITVAAYIGLLPTASVVMAILR